MTDIERVLARLAMEAGRLILTMRAAASHKIVGKADGSPQCAADRAADHLIRERLESLAPGLLVISEESVPQERADASSDMILVDPLDGTREFLEGRDEFAVNLAFVAAGRPQAGVVMAPALGEMFAGGPSGAFVSRFDPRDLSPKEEPRPLRIADEKDETRPIRAVWSRSHGDPRTEALLSRLDVGERKAFGSSLKFCRVAEGRADLYPRLAATMQWDSAAGEAVLAAAGGATLDLSGRLLRYGERDAPGEAAARWLNPPFVAASSRRLADRAAAAAFCETS